MIALIGDIHGQLEPLQWALSVTEGTFRISLGDVVDGPYDEACIELLQRHQVLVLQGNHDCWAANGDFVSNPQSDEVKRWLSALPLQHSGDGWLAWHSWYRTWYGEYRWEYLAEPEVAWLALQATEHQVVFGGHTHVPAVMAFRGRDCRIIQGQVLQQSPRVTIEPGVRYLVHCGRPTQCVVLYDEAQGEMEFVFADQPRFERRFSELLVP